VRGVLSIARGHARPLLILAVCFALVASTFSKTVLAFATQVASVYSFSFLALLFALLLPRRIWILSIVLAFGVLRVIAYVNELKITAVALPITVFDITMVATNPSILINATGLHASLYRLEWITASVLVTFLVLATAAHFLAPHLWRRLHGRFRPRFSSVGITSIAIVLALAAATVALVRQGRFIHDTLTTTDPQLFRDLWLPAAQVTLSRKLGVVEYVAFSSVAANEGLDLALGSSRSPSDEEIRLATAAFVARSHAQVLPNIVLFHAESTFDPNVAFRLSRRAELPLWSARRETRVLGPLRVNVVGGGSWVTEFEVVTGVDSRVFGYHGFYTHYYVAPRVKNSFAAYLTRRGYYTAAYYPADGSFYGVKKAFQFYGFKDFIDGRDLGLPADWHRVIDRDIVKAISAHGAFERSGPFFYFIATSENHGPHPCQNFRSDREFSTTFAGAASFEQNCQFNEYLRRARSTSDAFEAVLRHLTDVEARTGRPFVLVAYGDHQPWSFTDGRFSIPGGTAFEGDVKDFSAFRTTADPYQTFVHLLASDATVLTARFGEPPPASLLPTLISAFVARSDDDLYLPVNFVAFAECRSDIQSARCERYAGFARSLRSALLTDPPAVPSASRH